MLCGVGSSSTPQIYGRLTMKLKRNDELIPKRLKKLREEKGWSQTQAGDAIGAGRGAWQQWELRKRTPSDTALIAASYIFNVSLPKFFETFRDQFIIAF